MEKNTVRIRVVETCHPSYRAFMRNHMKKKLMDELEKELDDLMKYDVDLQDGGAGLCAVITAELEVVGAKKKEEPDYTYQIVRVPRKKTWKDKWKELMG